MKGNKWMSIINNALWVLNPFLLIIAYFDTQIQFGIYFKWLGKMHPLLLHFPIVLGTTIGLYYILDKKNKIDAVYANYILIINALLSSIVAIFGIFLSKQDSYDGSIILLHKWGGVSIALISWLFVYLQQGLIHFKNSYQTRWISSLMYLSVLFIFTHKGAQLTHGINAISFPEAVAAKKTDKVILDSNATLYEQAVKPILEQKCIGCHGTDKVKGALLLNSPENIIKGGKGGNILVSSKDKEATMFTRIHLPMSDEKHMPPDGKMQLTKEEVSILSRWIKAGGDFKTKMSAIAKTDSLFILANSYKPTESNVVVKKSGLPDLKSFNTNYCTVDYLFNGSDEIDVNFFQGNFYNPAQLKSLEKIKNQIVQLNLQNMPMKEEDIQSVAQFINLRTLNLNYTGLNIKALAPLKQMAMLNSLSICGVDFNEASLNSFLQKLKISNLHIWSTTMPLAKLQNIVSKYPAIHVTLGDNMENAIIKITPPIIDQDSSIISKYLDVKIKHLLNGVILKYTIDGTDPDSIKSPSYKNSLRLTKNTNLKVKAFRTGWISSDISQRTFYKSEIRPDSIFFITQPDKKFTGIGAKTLIDYELGAQNFSNGKWIGYKDSTMQFGISFKNPTLIHQVDLNSLINSGSYILPMVSILVEGSNDGKQFKKIKEIKYPPFTKMDVMNENKTFSCVFPTNTQFKYYKFTILNVKKLPSWHPGKGTPGWVFIDEIFLN